jgi:uncharacterized protein (TIGR00304 family)
MRRHAVVPAFLLLAGAIVIADAILRGAAAVSLIVVVPVVSGTSAEFLLGVVLLLVGFLTLPLAFYSVELASLDDLRSDRVGHGQAPAAEVGGMVLVGPVPIFFGSWKEVPRRTRVVIAVVAAAAFGLVVLAFLVR